VGFRATTVEVARRLQLAGWVRNLTDGDVELAAEGPAAAIDQLLAFLHTGPRGARVDGVTHEIVPAPGAPSNGVDSAMFPTPFETRRTV
jgi:acylphosphatase